MMQMSLATLPKHFNNELPTLWIDAMQIMDRDNPELILMRCFSFMPEVAVESCRLMTPVSHAKKIVDALARSLNYYPTPQTSQPADTSKE